MIQNFILQSKLESNTTEVHCTSSISAAVGHIMKTEYSLIILDLQLSDMDKSEMIRIIRVMQHIPVMVIGEHIETSEIIALYQASAHAHEQISRAWALY